MPGPKAPGLLFAAVLMFGAATAALAFPGVPRPGLLLSAGRTFAISGEPSDGGASLSIAPMWAVGEHVRFGVVGFADDMGTQLVQLTDPNDGTPLGTAADLHRWAWGAAWYAEADVFRATRWTGGAYGEFGYWRIEDDRRGETLAAGSALGLALGARVRRDIGGARQLGLAVCYRKLTQNQNSAWQRVDHYASAALELGWAPPQGND